MLLRHTPLHLAAGNSAPELVSTLIRLGADVHAKDGNGCTPLLLAKDLPTCTILLDAGADPCASDDEGRTALLFAASDGSLEIAKLLLSRGAVIVPTKDTKLYPIHGAAMEGHVEMVKWLMTEAGDEIRRLSGDHRSLLGLAALKGHLPLVEELLKIGLSPHPGKYYPPICDVALGGNVDILKIFLQHKANLNVTDKEGFLPLHCALENGHADMANMLLDLGARWDSPTAAHTTLNIACNSGLLQVATRLVSIGADVNGVDKKGFFPLLLAARVGHIELVKMLLSNLASPKNPKSSFCAVEWALEKEGEDLEKMPARGKREDQGEWGRQLEVVKELLTHGAPFNNEAIIFAVKKVANLALSPFVIG